MPVLPAQVASSGRFGPAAGTLANVQSWLNSRAEVRVVAGKGTGIYATQPIGRDEAILAWVGSIIPTEELERVPPHLLPHTVQIDDELFMVGNEVPQASDFVNHSCGPNAGFRGNVVLVAMREIEPGEEITYDYAMSDAAPLNDFECRCGADACRGRVLADDWLLPELAERYRGYFSTYLERRISRHQEMTRSVAPSRS